MMPCRRQAEGQRNADHQEVRCHCQLQGRRQTLQDQIGDRLVPDQRLPQIATYQPEVKAAEALMNGAIEAERLGWPNTPETRVAERPDHGKRE